MSLFDKLIIMLFQESLRRKQKEIMIIDKSVGGYDCSGVERGWVTCRCLLTLCLCLVEREIKKERGGGKLK